VPKTELCSLNVTFLELFQELVRMLADTAQHILYDLRSITCLTLEAWKVAFYSTRKVLICDSQRDLVLLARFREVNFEQ